MVEHQPSKLRVAGSSPVSRSSSIQGQATFCHESGIERSKGEVAATPDLSKFGPLVELVTTPPCHGGGQGFESPTDRNE